MVNRVKDYIQEYDVKRVRSNDKLLDVIKDMVEHGTEICVVIGVSGHIMGILNEVIIMHWRNKSELKDANVLDASQTSTVITVGYMHHMNDVAELFMNNHNVDLLVVVENGNPVGVIRKIDVLRWMLDSIK